jgi:hypothetical protein
MIPICSLKWLADLFVLACVWEYFHGFKSSAGASGEDEDV